MTGTAAHRYTPRVGVIRLAPPLPGGKKLSARGVRNSQSKTFYSVPQLAEMAGCSPYVMRGMLEANGVEVTPSGKAARRGIVFISSLAEALPELMDSIRLRREAGEHERWENEGGTP